MLTNIIELFECYKPNTRERFSFPCMFNSEKIVIVLIMCGWTIICASYFCKTWLFITRAVWGVLFNPLDTHGTAAQGRVEALCPDLTSLSLLALYPKHCSFLQPTLPLPRPMAFSQVRLRHLPAQVVNQEDQTSLGYILTIHFPLTASRPAATTPD